MKTFAYVAERDPLPSVFREALRLRYETRDEPLPPRLEELLRGLPEDDGSARFASNRIK